MALIDSTSALIGVLAYEEWARGQVIPPRASIEFSGEGKTVYQSTTFPSAVEPVYSDRDDFNWDDDVDAAPEGIDEHIEAIAEALRDGARKSFWTEVADAVYGAEAEISSGRVYVRMSSLCVGFDLEKLVENAIANVDAEIHPEDRAESLQGLLAIFRSAVTQLESREKR